jgi:DNA-directed RNA polymerase specialized sigma24 family protein
MDGAVERSEAEVAFNLAYRVLGSKTDAAEAVREACHEIGRPASDGERRFDLQLLTATRRACHELASRRRQPPASAGSPEETIAAASMRLPIRQREALALRELGQLSYVEIATVMETSVNAVTQLISRARINLSDELRGTVLASIAAPSPECERALPLIAMRNDGQLEAGSPDAAWLDSHLSACERCRLGVGAMREAATSYGAWAPIAAPVGLLGTTAQAMPPEAKAAPTPAPARRRPRSRPALVAGLALLLFLAGLSVALLRGDPSAPPLDPAADAAPPASAATPAPGTRAKAGEKKRRQGSKREQGAGSMQAAADDTSSAPYPTAVPVTTEASADQTEPRPAPTPSGEAAVEPTQKAPASKPNPKPAPVPTAAATQPAPAPTAKPAAEAPSPVAEEPAAEPPRRREPPGKPAGKPPK